MKGKRLLVIGVCLVLVLAVLPFMVACAPTPAPPAPPAPPPEGPIKMKYGPEWDKIVEAAKKEGELTIYGYAITEAKMTSFNSTFAKEYGIKINYLAGTTPELTEKIKTEAQIGQVESDIVAISQFGIYQLVDLGLIVPDIGDKLPEIAATTEADWKAPPCDTTGHFLRTSTFYCAPVINTDLVAPGDEPKSIHDLVDPKWKNKIIMASPTLNGTSYRWWVMADRYGIDRVDWFTKLGQLNPTIVSSHITGMDRLVKGEFAIQDMNYDGYVSEARKAGAPVKYVFLEEGTCMLVGGPFALNAQAPHPNAGLVFLNWLMTLEGLEAYNKPSANASIRTGNPSYAYPGTLPDKPIKIILWTDADDIAWSPLMQSGTIEKIMGVPVMTK
jgi:iron(III) transport system substrate-binding protein